uniref:SsfX1 n=1 Tax=Streptomyces sp. SF2575 TaxID=746675 RepID=D6MSX7_9ACTN|nr:SsfX1 [Streptomyces sp. SF2575]
MSRSTDTATDRAGLEIRVERGHARPEELAALTAILLARAAAPAAGPAAPERATAAWRRRRHVPGLHTAHSWQG